MVVVEIRMESGVISLFFCIIMISQIFISRSFEVIFYMQCNDNLWHFVILEIEMQYSLLFGIHKSFQDVNN